MTRYFPGDEWPLPLTLVSPGADPGPDSVECEHKDERSGAASRYPEPWHYTDYKLATRPVITPGKPRILRTTGKSPDRLIKTCQPRPGDNQGVSGSGASDFSLKRTFVSCVII